LFSLPEVYKLNEKAMPLLAIRWTEHINTMNICHEVHIHSFDVITQNKALFDITHIEDSGKINLCCISQELNVDRELGGIETLQRKAVDHHSIDNPFLMPLDAFFVTVFKKTASKIKSSLSVIFQQISRGNY